MRQASAFFKRRASSQPAQKLYCDGGCALANPSSLGGTWAWVLVSPTGQRLECDSGVVLPGELGMETISNNVMEMFATLQALEAMPVHWDGFLYSDSQVSLYRLMGSNSLNGLPKQLVQRLQTIRRRMQRYTPLLCGGHPTQEDLRVGYNKKGHPVSPHNAWCDAECNRQAQRLLAKK